MCGISIYHGRVGHPRSLFTLFRVVDIYLLLIVGIYFFLHSNVGVYAIIEIFFSLLLDLLFAYRNDPSQKNDENFDDDTKNKEKFCERVSIINSNDSPDTLNDQ